MFIRRNGSRAFVDFLNLAPVRRVGYTDLNSSCMQFAFDSANSLLLPVRSDRGSLPLQLDWDGLRCRETDIASESITPDSQERAYLFIKERILDLRFRTNQHLRAQELAEAMSLSRTPVREALGRLVQEGLVERHGGWGFIVRALTFQDVMDLFNVREVLEVESARAALARVDAGATDRLGATLNQSRRALENGRHVESIRIARRFHVAIAELSGNRLLLQMLQSINDRIHMVGLSLVTAVPERAVQVHEENTQILDAFIARDSVLLERAVRVHIHRSRDLFMQSKSECRIA
jgi:DNA-binding GntR family transcriptional regulator